MAFVKKTHDHSHLSPTQLAWAAGFIDGEGCITTATNGPNRSVHMIQISVCNTDKNVVRVFKKWFKCGTLCTNHQSQRNPRWLDSHTWAVRAKGAEEVIRVLLPYLRIKHRQAKVALRLRKAVYAGTSVANKGILAKKLRSFNGRRAVYA